MSLLQVRDLTYDYVNKSGVTHALQGVNVSFEQGKLYAITGRSGSGKTTLLSLLAAFDKPKSGTILCEGADITGLNLSEYRRKNIGIVFQAYNLIPHLTALDNVKLALDIAGFKRGSKTERAKKALLLVGLTEKHFKKLPLTLSGGEQQRVAIARAIVTDSKIILADEPTGNLDNANSRRIISLLSDLAHIRGKCVILVTHASEIAEEADVEYRMSDGVCADVIVRR